MINKRKLLFVVSFLAVNLSANACTIFIVTRGNRVIVGNQALCWH